MRCILVLLSTFYFAANLSFAQSIRIERITTKQGLSHGTVTSIMQDSLGYMWFGTQNGLNRYDGYGFKIFSHSPVDSVVLPVNIIRVIYQDKKGDFWLGIDNHGLVRFNPTSGRYKQYKHNPSDPGSLSHNDVYAICVDAEDNLWIGTYGGGLNLFDPTSGKFSRFQHKAGIANSISDDYIQAMHLDRKGNIWIGTERGGLNRFTIRNRTFTSYNLDLDADKSKKMAPVWAVCEDKSGYIWLATDGDGLLKFDQHTAEFQSYKHNPNLPGSLSHNNLTAMIIDHQGLFWIGTWGGGLNKFDPATGQATHFGYHPYLPDKLSSSTVYTLFQDRSGLVWVGTNGHGINKLNPAGSGFNTFAYDPSAPDGLSDNAVRAILEDADGVWVGTNGSGLDYLNLNTRKARHYKPDPENKKSLSGLAVIALCKDIKGNVWAGTYEDGLNKLDTRTHTFTRYSHHPEDSFSLSDNRVLALLEDEGAIWVGTYEGGLDKLNPESGHFEHFIHDPEKEASISSNGVRCLYKDRQGNIWIGTNNGLNLFNKKTKTFRRYTHNPDKSGTLSHNYIRCVYEDRKGFIWVGTSEGGLNRLDPKTSFFTTFKKKDGMPDDGIYGILGDKHNNLWISTNRGIARYNSDENKFTVYDEGDGLIGNEFGVGGYHQGNSGTLYFGSFKGLNAFCPDSIQENSFIPPVVISDIKIANTSKPQLLAQPFIDLDYDSNSISFEFAALSFQETEQNQYEYQLSGVDKDWVSSGTRRFVSYTNLEGGHYTFQVRAANSDGLWNKKGTWVKIYVKPPLWQERWFKAAMILLTGLLIVLVYKIRIRRIQVHNKKLEELVRMRTEELRQRSLQLEQSLRETQKQKQEAEQQRQLAEEANRIKTELTSITVHDLKNPLGGILMYTDLIRDAAEDPAKVTRLVQTIRETSQNMFHLISNLLKRTKLESSYISLQKDVIDFALLVRVATERNKLQASHKYQQLHLETESGCYAAVDLDLINDLIENLISNAIKFTPPHKNIWICVKSANEVIELIVKDEGLGFRINEMDKLFRPFQRLSAKPTGGESSTGLGLSIVHQIVQLHGGHIQVKSDGPGNGSTFIVSIPAIQLSGQEQQKAIPVLDNSIN